MSATCLALASLSIVVSSLLAATTHVVGPLEPHQALPDFQLPDGYRIELVTAEPEVVDPIAVAFDERGRMWVVEMRDYPTLGAGQLPNSKIRVLEDRDEDGKFETAHTFADGLLFPTGLQLWRGGAIVTLAGEIAYFVDSDDDGRADHKEIWYQGFATLNEQLRANHPRLAADGQVYVAGGLRGGTIENLRHPKLPSVSINGRDFAFDPVSSEGKAVSGNGQFGLAFDRFGRRFTCSNRNPLIHVAIEQRYLEANPKLIPSTVVHDVAAAGDESRIYPRSNAFTTSAKHAGQFTAACGIEIFGGTALPESAVGNAFVCEPTANIVHRESISPRGAVFASKPVESGREFLSATDEWFRPVNLHTGPDGALYVVDMYRAVIEHPEWMPDVLRNKADLRDGNDRGRIYRVVADSIDDRDEGVASCASQPIENLLKLLSHRNSWQRDTAFRLLLETLDESLRPQLRRMVFQEKESVGRYQALSLLGCLGPMEEDILLAALSDESTGVRERAIVLSESQLAGSNRLTQRVVAMANDPEARVRFQVALSLTRLPSEDAMKPLKEIAISSMEDSWTRLAVVLAARDQASTILADVLRHPFAESKSTSDRGGRTEMIRELAHAIVAGNDMHQTSEVLGNAAFLDQAKLQVLLSVLAEALHTRHGDFHEALRLTGKHNPQAARSIEQLFDRSLTVVGDSTALEAERIQAARMLGLDTRPKVVAVLLDVFQVNPSPLLKIAIIKALSPHDDARIPKLLLRDLAIEFPSVRSTIVDLLLTRRQWTLMLLNAVADGKIYADGIDIASSDVLVNHSDDEIRELAVRVLQPIQTSRADVLKLYEEAVALAGSATRGKQVFKKHCAACHRVAAEGAAIGPDIGDSAMKSPHQLLTDILDPNRAIDANFVSYVAVTQDGSVYQGIIRSEVDTGIELLTADGESIAIHRSNLESLTGGKSLMPDGFERQISVPQMADLLQYLRTWRINDTHLESTTEPTHSDSSS